MFRKFFSIVFYAALAGVLALESPAEVSAEFITSNGDIQAQDPSPQYAGQPPLVNITRMSLTGGRLYTNQVAGAPFQVGSTVRTVGVVTIGEAENGTNTPALLPDNSSLIVIFAIEGTIISSANGLVSAQFDVGRLFLASDQTGNAVNFSNNSAATWNFGNRFSEFALTPQQQIIDGTFLGISPAGGVSYPADQTNISAVNTVVQGFAQGLFLFREDSTAAQNAGIGFVNPGLGSFTGDDWLRNVDESPLTLPKLYEGIAAVTNQQARTSFTAPSAADLVVLNAIGFAAGFSGAFDEGGYTPTSLGQGTGDFVADLTGDAYIGYTPIPEPSSILLFALGSGSLVLIGRRRLNTKQAAT